MWLIRILLIAGLLFPSKALAQYYPDAEQISVTPIGDISSTNAQAAIEELDSEKSPTTHNHNLVDLLEKSYNSLTDKPDLSQLHAPATAGDGISILGQIITNADRGSVAVTGHENTYNHSLFLIEETDPVFTAWDKDYADLINKPDLSVYFHKLNNDLDNILTGTTNIHFTTSLKINYDTAYSWGNHAGLYSLLIHNHDLIYLGIGATATDSDKLDGYHYNNLPYLTSYTETDPLFIAWDKDYNDLINTPAIPDSLDDLSGTLDDIDDGTTYGKPSLTQISNWDALVSFPGFTDLSTDYGFTDNSTNWNTAYGWGNHAGLYDTTGTASGLFSTHESTYDHSLIATALQNETDPVFTVHQAYNITEGDITNLGNLFGINTGDQDLSGLQPLHANLTSLAGLPYSSASFVKITGANTFSLDTNTYSLSNHDHSGVYQPADADLDDLADGSLSASKVEGVADADYGDVSVSGGVWTVEVAGGATAYDDIGDPDAATTVGFDDTETITYTTSQNTAGSFFTIDNTVADVTNNVYLLELKYTDDGQTNADFFKCSDNNGDVKFSIQEEGNTLIVGTLGVTGAITGNLTGNADTATSATSAITATTANAGDSATAFFSSGTIEHEYGGLEADVSGYSGLLAISAGATSEVDALSELIAQLADVTAFITDDDMPAAGADPDIDAVGEIGRDIDDHWLRGFDGSIQYVYGQKAKIISFTVTNPDLLTETAFLPIWTNKTGATFEIMAIYSVSDVDDAIYTLKFTTNGYRDHTNLTTIEAITISTNGTGIFYNDLTSGIDSTTIADGVTIGYDAGATDCDFIHGIIVGYLDGDVN